MLCDSGALHPAMFCVKVFTVARYQGRNLSAGRGGRYNNLRKNPITVDGNPRIEEISSKTCSCP